MARPSFAHFVLPRLFSLLLLLGLCGALQPVTAKTSAAEQVWSHQLEVTRGELDAVKTILHGSPDDAQLQSLRLDTLRIYRQASDVSNDIAPKLADLQQRQAELGDAPSDAEESSVIQEERSRLDAERLALDSQSRFASLIALDASQALEAISTQRRELFQARLGQRSDSIVSGAFWRDLASTTPLDTMRSRSLLEETRVVIEGLDVWQWLLVAAWLVLVAGFGVMLRQRLWRYSQERVVHGRLRRVVYGWSRIMLAVLVPVVMLLGLRMGLTWVVTLSEVAQDFIVGLTATAAFCGYTLGLGQSLLMSRQPSWRLLPIGDATASALRHLPLWAALFIGLTWLAENLAVIASARLSIIILIHSVAGLVLIFVLGNAFLKLPATSSADDERAAASDAPWLSRLLARRRQPLHMLAWLALLFSLACLLIGYVALASFILKQVIWSAVVLGTAYLLSMTATDLTRLFARRVTRSTAGQTEGTANTAAPRHPGLILVNGLAQVAIAVLTLMMLLAPYGQESLDVYQQLSNLRGSLAIGDIQLRPAAIAQGILLFLLGIAAVKAMQHWLTHSLLPATRMEPGMQVSASTLAGYVGYVIVVATALSATGVGLERVTWIASALSVGIGFGLQAIVQNFVSGLILLTERPVKVGDWVSLSGVEGDIRRINVRATEIQMSDRSTMVVPNSEFITKMVRNVTHANSLGRIQIKLPLPLDTDAEVVRTIILEIFGNDPAVLASPAPSVLLEDISAAGLAFNAVAYVSSPRGASTVRSRLLFELLSRLRSEGIALSSPPTMLLSQKSSLDHEAE